MAGTPDQHTPATNGEWKEKSHEYDLSCGGDRNCTPERGGDRPARRQGGGTLARLARVPTFHERVMCNRTRPLLTGPVAGPAARMAGISPRCRSSAPALGRGMQQSRMGPLTLPQLRRGRRSARFAPRFPCHSGLRATEVRDGTTPPVSGARPPSRYLPVTGPRPAGHSPASPAQFQGDDPCREPSRK